MNAVSHLMRILVLVPSLFDSLGGIQTFSQALVWSLNDLAGTPGALAKSTIRVLGLHDSDSGRAKPDLARQLPHVRHAGFSGSKFRFGITAILAARQADVVLMAHIHFAPLLRPMRWLAPDLPCRIAAHGIEVWKPLSASITSTLRTGDEIWAVSDYTRHTMMAENPTLSASVAFSYLPNTLGPTYPPATAVKSRNELGLSGGPLLLCVSRMSSLEPYKNVDSVIRCMHEVRQQVPEVKLVIVGPGDDRPRLERIVEELHLRDHVQFQGRVTDDVLQSYFAACDVFVLPSTGEGFGIVYLEAMYHAKACIGARAGGAPEVIEEGETGLLVDVKQPKQLSQAILGLLCNDAARVAMGKAGKERLEREFSITRFRERLAERFSPAYFSWRKGR